MRIPTLILGVLFLAVVTYAADNSEKTYTDAFTRTAKAFTTQDMKVTERPGPNGTKVVCTILPKGRVIAVAWEIDNPHKTVLNIAQDGMKLYSELRELKQLEPARVAAIIYGGPRRDEFKDSLIDAAAPSEYMMPRLARRSQGEEDIFATSFDFAKTVSSRLTGMTYYDNFEHRGRLRSEITLNGEVIKFEFE